MTKHQKETLFMAAMWLVIAAALVVILVLIAGCSSSTDLDPVIESDNVLTIGPTHIPTSAVITHDWFLLDASLYLWGLHLGDIEVDCRMSEQACSVCGRRLGGPWVCQTDEPGQ